MRTVASEIEATEASVQAQQKSRAVSARKSRLRRLALEGLEERTLMSVLPAATTSTLPIDLSGTNGNESSPQIAVDRYDPNKMVAVWVRNDPSGPLSPTNVRVVGAYSNNGGQSWTSFDVGVPVLRDPNVAPTVPFPGNVFTQITDPSVGFDANGQFYVLLDEHATDNNGGGGAASGAVVLTKFDFNNSAPTLVPFVDPYTANSQDFNIVYEWANSTDAVIQPTMAVDDNQASFTDPATGQTQTDPYANNVYVSWATNTNAPANAQNFNPNTIRLIGSADGGQTFTNPTILNDNAYFGGTGQQRDSAPRITVSQGRLPNTAAYGPADPGVPGGMVTAVWDDFNSLANLRPIPGTIRNPRRHRLLSNRHTFYSLG